MLDLGRLAWLIKELVARTSADRVIPIARVLNALLAIYRITARYRPILAKTPKVIRVVLRVVKIILESMLNTISPCLRAKALYIAIGMTRAS